MNYIYQNKELKYPDPTYYYSPSMEYPEYPWKTNTLSAVPNPVYEAIRNIFISMQFDVDNIGTKEWNPLVNYISPGNTVLLKPNFVHNINRNSADGNLDCLVTHPSIIRCILDYVIIALKHTGTIYVGDAPIKDCNFDLLMEQYNYNKIFEFMTKNEATPQPVLSDLRGPDEERQTVNKSSTGIIINLGEESFFYKYQSKNTKYRIPNYNYQRVEQHHHNNVHEYCINSIALQADVIINLPKPKTHRKNGYTGALKNFVGINYCKEYLPHHTCGAVTVGGDEFEMSSIRKKVASHLRNYLDIKRADYSKFPKILWKIYWMLLASSNFFCKDKILEGAWYLNDTLWKTVLDINLIVQYVNKNGKLCSNPQRKILSLGDLIVAGEKEGPLTPSPKPVYTLLFADNSVEFDSILVKLMGFKKEKIKTLLYALANDSLFQGNYDTIMIYDNIKNSPHLLKNYVFQNEPFIAASGWRGFIEI